MVDAAKLVNKTVPIPGDPGYYIAEIDILHQLHCLNMLRKKIWSREMGLDMDGKQMMEMDRVEHCIDSLRQNLMCSSDISVIPYAWIEEDQQSKAVGRIIHTCRDFDAIKCWALQNRVKHFDTSIHVPDPLQAWY